MQRDILNILEQKINSLTKSQKKVADYIIKNPMEAAFSTIDQISHNVETSTTTIVRLALFLGFTGYAEFQKELQEILKSRTAPSTKLEISFQGDKADNDVIRGIAKMQLENSSRTFDSLSDDMVFKAERMLKKARRIYVIGFRSCFSIAHFLSYNLNRIYNKCSLLSFSGGELYEHVNQISAEDVVIALTMPRYLKEVTSVAEIAKERQASVIAITDGYLSPLASFADITFSTECKSSDFHNSVFSAMLVAEILIGVCTMENLQSAKKNLKDAEVVLRKLDVHVNK